jgi:hypothetical protein
VSRMDANARARHLTGCAQSPRWFVINCHRQRTNLLIRCVGFRSGAATSILRRHGRGTRQAAVSAPARPPAKSRHTTSSAGLAAPDVPPTNADAADAAAATPPSPPELSSGDGGDAEWLDGWVAQVSATPSIGRILQAGVRANLTECGRGLVDPLRILPPKQLNHSAYTRTRTGVQIDPTPSRHRRCPRCWTDFSDAELNTAAAEFELNAAPGCVK